MLRSLGIDPLYIPRDLDIVRIGKKEPYEGADLEVSKNFMPEDFKKGHGVEVLSDKDIYFDTRDFTINEVLATDSNVLVTRQALLDTIRKIVRITNFEMEKYYKGAPKILSKILKFYSEAIYRYGDAKIEDVEDWEFEECFISPFWLALQLDKAMEVSSSFAEEYIKQLKDKRTIPGDLETIEEVANYLLSIMRQDNDNPFYFRYAPTKQFSLEEEWFEEKFDNNLAAKNVKGY